MSILYFYTFVLIKSNGTKDGVENKTSINITPVIKYLYGRAKYFWIVFTIKLKRNNLRHELKKNMLKQALI
jgi:hypothetical protein